MLNNKKLLNYTLLKLCLSSIYTKNKKKKNIISLSPQKINIQDNITISNQQKIIHQNKIKIQKLEKAIKQTPADWQYMNFHHLCNLSPQVKDAIQLTIKKTSFSQEQQIFNLNTNANPYQILNPYWLNIYQFFNHKSQVDKQFLLTKQKNSYNAQIYFNSLEEQESRLCQIIKKFLQNIHQPRKLQTIAQPTFCKYILSLKRDLSLKGVNIRNNNQQEDISPLQIKILKILNYQYEFWIDVKLNRAKNGKQQDFIIQKREIDNPNNSSLMKKNPKIRIKYIVRKKKRKQIQKCFCNKVDILIQVNGNKHIIKLQWKGPSDKKIQNLSKDQENLNKYWVIDYDNIFRGNPTLQPVFQF